jgi:hypothetical protein
LSLQLKPHEEVEPDEAANAANEELVSSHKKAKRKVRASKSKGTPRVDATDNNRNTSADDLPEAIESLQPPRAETIDHENKKVSGSWRWNIDPDNILPKAKAEAFQRPSDLFAFHALSIAKSLFEATASRKAIHHKIQAMLDEIPDTEYTKWVESFQKLHSGDDTMLVRVPPEPESTICEQRFSAATPAPIDMRMRVTKTSRDPRGADHNAMHAEVDMQSEYHGANIKRELDISSRVVEGKVQEIAPQGDNNVVTASFSFRSLSIKAADKHSTPKSTTTKNATSTEELPTRPRTFRTPIVDLLCGQEPFDSRALPRVARAIVDKLENRVKAHVSMLLAWCSTTLT